MNSKFESGDHAPNPAKSTHDSADTANPSVTKSENQIASNNHQANGTKECKNPPDWVIRGTAILALVISATVAIIYYCQLREMQKQTANAARAWLGFQQEGTDKLPVAIDRVQTSPTFAVDAHYTIENFGRGPAIKVMQSSWVIENNPGLSMIQKTVNFTCDSARAFSTGTVPTGPQEKSPAPMGYILFPGQTHAEQIHWRGSNPVSPQWVYIVGCVAYLDQFSKPHWTRFCVLTGDGVPPLTGGSRQMLYSLFNDTDETATQQKAEQ